MEKDAAKVLANKTGHSLSETTAGFRSNAPISLGENDFWAQVSSNPFFTAVGLNPFSLLKLKMLNIFKGDRTGWVWCHTGNSAKEFSSWGKSLEETSACRR